MNQKIRSYEDLAVYQKAYRLALEVHKRSLEFPRVEQYGLASQIRNSTKSICGNIAEGFGKQAYSKAEFRRYLNVAIGSADESKVWLDFAKDLGYIDDTNFADWKGDLTDIAKMLTGLYKSWG